MNENAAALSAHFGRANEIVRVEVPEAPLPDGKPSVIRFRTCLTVADLEALGEMGGLGSATLDQLRLALFRILAVNEDGTAFVSGDVADVVKDGSSGRLLCSIVERAGLVEKAFADVEMPEAPEGGEAGKP